MIKIEKCSILKVLLLEIDVYLQSWLLNIQHLVAKSHAPGGNNPIRSLRSIHDCKGKHLISLNPYTPVVPKKPAYFRDIPITTKSFKSRLKERFYCKLKTNPSNIMWNQVNLKNNQRIRQCLSRGTLGMKGLKRVSGQGPVIWGMTEKWKRDPVIWWTIEKGKSSPVIWGMTEKWKHDSVIWAMTEKWKRGPVIWGMTEKWKQDPVIWAMTEKWGCGPVIWWMTEKWRQSEICGMPENWRHGPFICRMTEKLRQGLSCHLGNNWEIRGVDNKLSLNVPCVNGTCLPLQDSL